MDQEIALSYAQEIITLLYETVPGNEMQQIRGQLPDDFDPLFELADGETTTK